MIYYSSHIYIRRSGFLVTLEELKISIEKGIINRQFIIFEYSDTDFIPKQYIKEIARILGNDIEYIDDLSSISGNSLYDDLLIDDKLYVYCTKTLEYIEAYDNLIVIVKDIEKSLREQFSEYIITVPKLEDWHIKDYVYSNSGVSNKYSDLLIKVCKNDIYKIDDELFKLSLLNNVDDNLFLELFNDGVFGEYTESTGYDLVNAVFYKDTEKLKKVLFDLQKINFNAIGFITLLHNACKTMISVQLGREKPSTMSDKQYYVLRKKIGTYNNTQLLNLFKFICNLDYEIKSGNLSVDDVLDYTIMNIYFG